MFYSKFLVIIRQLPGEKANSIRPRANVGRRTSSIWMPSGRACGWITASSISISSTTSITIAAINIYPSWNLCGPRWDRRTESSRPIITSPSGWRFRTGVWLTCPAQCDNLATKRQVNHSPIYWSTDGLMATLISTTISRVFKGGRKRAQGRVWWQLGVVGFLFVSRWQIARALGFHVREKGSKRQLVDKEPHQRGPCHPFSWKQLWWVHEGILQNLLPNSSPPCPPPPVSRAITRRRWLFVSQFLLDKEKKKQEETHEFRPYFDIHVFVLLFCHSFPDATFLFLFCFLSALRRRFVRHANYVIPNSRSLNPPPFHPSRRHVLECVSSFSSLVVVGSLNREFTRWCFLFDILLSSLSC